MTRVGTLLAALLSAIVVVDGDTVKLDGVSCRLLGFDTPETFYARCSQERALGKAATARLRELVETKTVRLEPTGASCRYRRICAKLFVEGRDVAEIMIGEGLAVPYDGRGPRRDWCQ